MPKKQKSLTEYVKDVVLIVPDITYKQLVLLTWKEHDGIEIPDSICKMILESGSNPETIGRKRRLKSQSEEPSSRYLDYQDIFIKAKKEYENE